MRKRSSYLVPRIERMGATLPAATPLPADQPRTVEEVTTGRVNETHLNQDNPASFLAGETNIQT